MNCAQEGTDNSRRGLVTFPWAWRRQKKPNVLILQPLMVSSTTNARQSTAVLIKPNSKLS